MSNLQTRTITAIILGVVTLLITFFGGTWFTLLAIAIGAAVFHEWVSLTAARQTPLSRIFGWSWFALIAASLLWGGGALASIGALFFGAAIMAVLTWKSGKAWPTSGLLYAGLPSISLSLLRGDEPFGFTAIVFLFAVVWGTDIAAYFTGRAIGGPKLAPRFSPNKTWSGAIGGAVAGVAAGTLVVSLLAEPVTFLAPLLAFVLSVIAQMGDLAESWVKRIFGAKDSGRLLPGHGGFMDRVDGLVAAAVLMYLIGAIFAQPDVPSAIFFSI
ncbi:phosphatidate cytidylyltransferase [Phyllobacterium leguminum]|uniref:Phosphatidate cytidylyltransferase n=1 Tax=Phyllobacterium leguminum TaxID=314237 RepID=A0A318T0Z8_9HYPH|nr:CDP-archaeol synthase [Phyllobacterium leguminum]PYE88167.1 phosphatidate cytidylyltransferase [Phyllobacterium leguminum]